MTGRGQKDQRMERDLIDRGVGEMGCVAEWRKGREAVGPEVAEAARLVERAVALVRRHQPAQRLR